MSVHTQTDVQTRQSEETFFFSSFCGEDAKKIVKYPECEAGLALSVPPPLSAQGKLRDFGTVLTLNFLTSALERSSLLL